MVRLVETAGCAMVRPGWPAEDVRELKVLWQLTANVDLVCQRVVELAPGGGWQTNVLVDV